MTGHSDLIGSRLPTHSLPADSCLDLDCFVIEVNMWFGVDSLKRPADVVSRIDGLELSRALGGDKLVHGFEFDVLACYGPVSSCNCQERDKDIATSQEKWHGVASSLRAVHHSMHGRHEEAICEHCQGVSNIDDERAWNWRGLNPLACVR